MEFAKAEETMVATDADVLSVSRRIIAQNKEAYEVLSR
jgi:antitoxin Phd